MLAAPGVLVPKEDNPRAYYTDTPPEGEAGYTVAETAYILRRVADGDLVEVGVPAPAPAPAPKKKGGE